MSTFRALHSNTLGREERGGEGREERDGRQAGVKEEEEGEIKEMK